MLEWMPNLYQQMRKKHIFIVMETIDIQYSESGNNSEVHSWFSKTGEQLAERIKSPHKPS